MKRSHSPLAPTSQKLRDSCGSRVKSQVLNDPSPITEDGVEGANYIIDGRLRRVTPYFYQYNTYCKLRWRDKKLIDIFIEEFRDRDADFYRKNISAGKVTLDGTPSTIDSVVKNGQLISHKSHRHEPPVTSMPIRIVHEDNDIIAIDKPSGIPVHPTGRYRFNSVTKIFQHEFGKIVHPCNRLDRLTSGLMFLGKSALGSDKMVQQIKQRSVKKEYLARCVGKFESKVEVVVDLPLKTVSPKVGLNRVDVENGKEAKTTFQRVSYDPVSNTSIVKCKPSTGRTHQIRVHLQYLGHPIANDPIYSNEYVWGPELGKNGAGNDEEVTERLDSIGKTRSSSSWILPQNDGEKLAESVCETCETELYTDPGPNELHLWLHAYKYYAEDLSWSYKTAYPEWAVEPHRQFMIRAIEEAEKCGETQTQYNVGAVLVNNGEIISTGHSRELPGNTHAEQCALEKYFTKTGKSEVPPGTEIYTTMEPCTLRLSGNLPCTNRILEQLPNIKTCFVGVVEPDTFVKNNTSAGVLEERGINYIQIPGYEEKILEIAKRGHEKISPEEPVSTT